MKKIYILLTLFTINCALFTAFAQVPELWGMTHQGGTNFSGAAFKINGDGSNFSVIHNFTWATGDMPPCKFTLYNNNGLLYGITYIDPHWGTIFSMDTISYTFTVLHNFNNPILGVDPIGSLILGSNNKFYGISLTPTTDSGGVLFCFDPATNIYTVAHYFTDSAYCAENLTLMQSNNGLIYGSLQSGGSNHHGLIFSFDPISSSYTDVHDFDTSIFNNPSIYSFPHFIQATNGLLYSLSPHGGDYNYGEIFSFNTTTNTYTNLHNFNDTLGANPQGSLLQANNGLLYGMTFAGGLHNSGVIFSLDISTDSYTDIYDFNGTTGGKPFGSLIQANDNKLYGMTSEGGTNGVVFSFDITTNIYTNIHNFNGTDGSDAISDLIEFPCPAINLSVSTNTSICNGDSVSLSANGTMNYKWQPGNFTDSLIKVSPSTTTTYLVTGFNTIGYCFKTDTIIVTVNPTPTPTIGGGDSLCSGDSLMIYTDFYSHYIWNNGDTTSINYITTAGTYTVTVTDSHGCTAIDSLNITVNPSPVPTITANGATTFCQGDSVTLTTATFTNYNWNNGATTETITPKTSGTYIVTVTTAFGCIGAATDSVNVIPLPIVTSSFHSDTTIGCSPLTIKFINTSTNGITYLWNFCDGSTDTALNPVHTYTDSGTYTITLISTNVSPCGTVTNTFTQTNYISVNVFKPVAAFISNYLTPIFTSDSIHFQDESYDPTFAGISLWQWWFGDGTGTHFENPIHQWNLPGIYQVELIVTNKEGCKDSAIFDYIDVIEGILNIPNTFTPNNDGYNDFFEIKASGIETYQLEIFNRWGIKIFSSTNINTSWDGYNQNGIQCPEGTYYYVLKATGFSGNSFNKAGFIMLLR